MASKILNYKTFFKNKIILIASVVTILEAFVSYSINILMGNTRAIQSLLKPLCFSKAFTNVLSYIFSFDYFIVMYGAAMFLFFCLSKKDKKLNTAAFLLFLSGLLRLIYSSIQLIMVLFFGLYTTSPESEAYYQLAGISATFLFAVYLPQFVFFCSVRKSIKYNINTHRGAKITAITGYILAVLMLIPIIRYGYDVVSLALMISSSGAYLVQAVVAHNYYNFVRYKGYTQKKKTPYRETRLERRNY